MVKLGLVNKKMSSLCSGCVIETSWQESNVCYAEMNDGIYLGEATGMLAYIECISRKKVSLFLGRKPQISGIGV